jgi:hypothetical protein
MISLLHVMIIFIFQQYFKKKDKQFQDDWIEHHRKNAILQFYVKLVI